jgi:peptidoglycan-associated lipoprotein
MRRTSYALIALAVLMFSANACKPKKVGATGGSAKTKTSQGTPGGTNLTPAQAPTITLTAVPNPINMGQSTTLSWESRNADGVNIDNGIGTVEASGRRTISPRDSTTYKATATGADGRSATAEVRVTVDSPISVTPPDQPPIKNGDIPAGEKVRSSIKDAFFDYDQYTIRNDAREALIFNARLLAQYPSVRITIEGYCDERGSEKYNLALGDRRANSAKDFLTAQGVEGSRIDTISYGKENNFCEEHNEECWQLNRRAHFTIR